MANRGSIYKTSPLVLKAKSRARVASVERSNPSKVTEKVTNEKNSSKDQNRGGLLGGIGYAWAKSGLATIGLVENVVETGLGALFNSQVLANSTGLGLAKLFGADDFVKKMQESTWVDYDAADKWYNPSEEWKNIGRAASVDKYLVTKVLEGATQTLEGVDDYITGGLASLAGAAGIDGAEDYAKDKFDSDWIRYGQADEWFDPEGGWKIAGDVASGIGTSVPAIAANFIPAVGPAVSIAISGFGAAGNATKEAYRETGKLGAAEYGYGALVGGTEAAIELVSMKLATGTGGLSKTIASKVSGKAVKSTAKAATNATIGGVAKKLGKDFLSEAAEEGIAELAEPLYRNLLNEKGEGFHYDLNPDDVVYAALVGGVTGALMGGVDVKIKRSSSIKTAENVIADGKLNSVLSAAELVADSERTYQTGYGKFRQTQGLYDQLRSSLDTTGGEVTTKQQKIMLGELTQSLAVATQMPAIEKSATKLLLHAEESASVASEQLAPVAEQMGLVDADGKPMTLTAESIIGDIDMSLYDSRKRSDRKLFAQQVRQAIGTNPILTALAVADAYADVATGTGNADADVDVNEAGSPHTSSAETGGMTSSAPTIEDFARDTGIVAETGAGLTQGVPNGTVSQMGVQKENAAGGVFEGQAAQSENASGVESDEAIEMRRVVEDTGMPQATVDAMVETYRPVEGMTAREYAAAFAEAEMYGRRGMSEAALARNEQIARLPADVARAAYGLGVKAADNTNAGVQKENATAGAGAGVKYALSDALQTLGDYDATRRRHIESSGKDKISRDYNEIMQFIREAPTKKETFERLHIGVVNDATADLVESKTGQNIRNYDVVLTSNFTAHIFEDHGNQRTETPRNQIAVNITNIENIIETVISPDDVRAVQADTGPALRFEKTLDGQNVALMITSTKRGTLTLKSAWIIDNSGGRTPSANAQALAGTSKTNSRSSTNNSIPQSEPGVNKKNTEISRPSLRPGRVLRAEGVNVQKFSDAQYATYKAAEIMARALGTDIVIHESLGKTKDGKVINGYFDPGDGRIHVNINAMRDGSHVGLYVLSHEVTHAIKEWSPRKYAELERFVMERLGADAEVKIEAKLKQMRDAGLISETATEAEAYALAKEEVVAEGMENVLSDGKVLEALAKQNRTLWQKIKDVVTAAIGKIKAAFGDLNKHSKTAKVLTDTVESLESIEQLFYEGVVDAGENRRGGRADGVTRMNSGKMQVGDYTVRYVTAEENKDTSIKEQLKKHAERLQSMPAVTSIDYEFMSKKQLHEKVSAAFKEIGYKVDRKNFGVIEIGEKQIDKSINYINTEGEKAAFLTIPAVLKRGEIVSGHENHKGRDYDTITIAAPVEVNGERGIVGAVVTKIDGKNKYRVHRILSPDGSEFIFDSNKRNAESTSGEPLSSNKRAPINSASKNSISQDGENVNRKFSTSDDTGTNADASETVEDEVARIRAEAEAKIERVRAEAEAKIEKAQKRQDDRVAKERERADARIEGWRERRQETKDRHAVRRATSRLYKRLLSPTKERNVPESLRAAVAEALGAMKLDARVMDQIAAIEAEIEKLERQDAPDLKKIETLESKLYKLEENAATLKEQSEAILRAYEAAAKEKDSPLADEIVEKLRELQAEIGESPVGIYDMDRKQLRAARDFYEMILHQVTNANKMLAADRQATVDKNGTAAMIEMSESKAPKFLKPRAGEARSMVTLRKYLWQMLKPINAVEMLGSDTLSHAFANLHRGEGVCSVDLAEAQEKFQAEAETYHFWDWDRASRREFKTANGKTVKLTLGQMMSLYAYSKRENAHQHLREGGFTFAPDATYKGKITERMLQDSERYTLTEAEFGKIASALTEEQRAFADAMQEYLSKDMAAKGNEVSVKLYGIKLFGEENYWPMRSAREYLDSETGKTGDPKIKNKGFTKRVVPDAGNPLVLSDFMETWNGHVGEMALYHGMTLPMEDMNRLLNFKPGGDFDAEGADAGRSTSITKYSSMKELIREKYGYEAVTYIEQLLRDLNGGVRSGVPMDLIDKGISLFKKSAVMASASVVIQQPSSIARAWSMINPKYFANTKGLDFKNSRENYEELKKYAPIAIVKEMGGFDTGVGQATSDYIMEREYKGGEKLGAFFKDKAYRDHVFGYAASKADQMAWLQLWEACKREQAELHPDMAADSDEVMKLAGERFTDIVAHTQVYDSTLSRSAMMRSKDTTWKMATAFMAEPTTVFNMLVMGTVKLQRGDAKAFRGVVGSVIAATFLNAVLASLVYAARDDDEDKSYPEKYVEALVGESIDSFNPLTLLPIVKDIWSLVQGYNVERTDMAVVADLIDALNKLKIDENTTGEEIAEKWINLAVSFSSVFGLPLRNLQRDARAVGNVISNKNKSTWSGVGYAARESAVKQIPFGKLFGVSVNVSDGQQLYEAAVTGNDKQYARVTARFESETAARTALRTALRDNDPRIEEAARARLDADTATYARLVREIVAEGYFSQTDVVAAVNSEYNAMVRDIESGVEDNADPDAGDEAIASIYKSADLNAELDAGDWKQAKVIIDDMVDAKIASGKSQKQARAAIKSGVTSYWKPLYLEAYASRNSAELRRIRALLARTRLYGTASEVAETVAGWVRDEAKKKAEAKKIARQGG